MLTNTRIKTSVQTAMSTTGTGRGPAGLPARGNPLRTSPLCSTTRYSLRCARKPTWPETQSWSTCRCCRRRRRASQQSILLTPVLCRFFQSTHQDRMDQARPVIHRAHHGSYHARLEECHRVLTKLRDKDKLSMDHRSAIELHTTYTTMGATRSSGITELVRQKSSFYFASTCLLNVFHSHFEHGSHML